ncbi:hypothetical protein IWX46DRAFT_613882 [Phyllosticta citricarpa]|uniref:Secreted protein n=1 Tax=Phyllosticta citricarpa TaxID=55181 RepID=A0ABR1LC18_9PEZI
MGMWVSRRIERSAGLLAGGMQFSGATATALDSIAVYYGRQTTEKKNVITITTKTKRTSATSRMLMLLCALHRAEARKVSSTSPTTTTTTPTKIATAILPQTQKIQKMR